MILEKKKRVDILKTTGKRRTKVSRKIKKIEKI